MNKNQTLFEINAAIAAMLDSNWSYFSAPSYMKRFFADGIIRWPFLLPHIHMPVCNAYTAISKKVVGKSARDNPERYCGWFWVRCSSKKFERMAQEAVDVCLRVLKESNQRKFDSYSVRNSILIISYITFRDCRVHIFADNLSRNSCIWAFFCAHIYAYL